MPISSVLGSSALLPAGLGFRNKIINGDFNINQRGFTSTTTDNAYGFDRWFCYMAGATTTYSSQSFTAGNAIPGQEPTKHARVVTAGSSASNNYSIFAQKIEDVRTCAGQQVTVSFWAKAASGTPSIGVELIQNFGSGGSGEVAQFISKVTLSTSWVRYSVTGILPSISGKTIGTSSILILALWCSAGSDFNSRTGSIGIQNNTIDFWGVQLEQNYQPTPFEQRPIGTELALCQRYYWKTKASSNGVFGWSGSGFAYSTTEALFTVGLPVTMRVAPTSVDVASLRMTDLNTAYTISTLSIATNRTTVDALTLLGSSSGLTVYRPLTLEQNNTIDGYIGANAEL